MTETGHSQSRRRRFVVHLPFLLVMAVVAAGIVRIVLYHWRDGTTLIGGALLLAAGLRLVLPDEQAGLIMIRKRPVDVVLYAAFAVMMIFVSLSIEGGPLH